ncbi:MAG: helix-turn-helix transcriptional regulator [Gammaproteobacteria bacterium]
MSVRQVARYLQINEKKVYALVSNGELPATKVTGKWLFPKDLVDMWLLESAHGGLLTDRMLIAGSDDPLLYRLVLRVANQIQARALISYTATGTQLGLSLLARRRADVCGIHWGPAEESRQRHPALLKQYNQHRDWVMVRLFLREQGLMLAPGNAPAGGDLARLFTPQTRWVSRQEGAGSQRFLQEIVSRHGLNPAARRVAVQAYSERDAASMIAMGHADVGTGVRAAASEFGLDFVPIGWEAFDFALPRGIFFRTLFQKLLEQLRSPECQRLGQMLGGYDFTDSGSLIWPV